MSDFPRFSALHLESLRARWAMGPMPPGESGAHVAKVSFTDDVEEDTATLWLTPEQFYELREAVNDLYDHIREEQSTD